MTKISLYFVLLFSTSTFIISTVQCMEKNDFIGYIDKLMIQRKAQKKGFPALETKVNEHLFVEQLQNLSIPIPFTIIYAISKQEDSKLSRRTFHILNKKNVIFTSINPLNRKQNLIDHCTEWLPTEEVPNAVILQAHFYDKDALITMIKTLQK